jgi:dihydropteroate synthase
VTPDSFSGDGVMQGGDYTAAAADLAARMIGEGADILDIGGESSRPGAVPVPAEKEIRRVAPVIEAIHKQAPNMPIAVDTVKANVAKVALDAGASIVNDISALQGDADMAALIAKRGAYVVLMHNRSGAANRNEKIGGEYKAPEYGNMVEDVANDLAARLAAARKAGIAPDKIIADPGLGFGKTPEQNCALINQLDRIKSKLGVPVLIGPSRKSFIGRILDLPPDQRLEGTAAAVAAGALRGADIVRVHDVKFMARLVAMTHAIAKSRPCAIVEEEVPHARTKVER